MVSGVGAWPHMFIPFEGVVRRRWSYAEPGVLEGHWSGRQLVTVPDAVLDLTLRTDGSFSLIEGFDFPEGYDDRLATTTGTYEIPRDGCLVMRSADGRVVRTLAVRVDESGTPRPDLGVWLTKADDENSPPDPLYLAPVIG